jgi:hypothetical protein
MPLGPPCWAAAQTCPATRANIPRRRQVPRSGKNDVLRRIQHRAPGQSAHANRARHVCGRGKASRLAVLVRAASSALDTFSLPLLRRQAWPPRHDETCGARPAHLHPILHPRPRAGPPFPPRCPARIESVPPSCNKASHSGAAAAATEPAPPRHLDSSSKSGAPRHKVRAVDTRARPAKGMEVRSPLRRLWKAGRGAPAGATKPVCGAPRRPMRPRHRRGQSTPAVEAMLPR